MMLSRSLRVSFAGTALGLAVTAGATLASFTPYCHIMGCCPSSLPFPERYPVSPAR